MDTDLGKSLNYTYRLSQRGGSPEQKEMRHRSEKEDLLIFYLCFVIKYVKQILFHQNLSDPFCSSPAVKKCSILFAPVK